MSYWLFSSYEGGGEGEGQGEYEDDVAMEDYMDKNEAAIYNSNYKLDKLDAYEFSGPDDDSDDDSDDESSEFPGLEILSVLRRDKGDDEAAIQAFHMSNFWINCLGYTELKTSDEIHSAALENGCIHDTFIEGKNVRVVVLIVKKTTESKPTLRSVAT
jgi:hypothetical protein